jgi:hypothetical protein
MKIRKPTAQELEHWEKVLAREGFSMQRGFQPNRVMYVENTDIYQTTKTRTGRRGGRVRKYKLGERKAYTMTCLRCGSRFSSKRRDAKACSKACNKWLERNRNVADKTLNSEEQN